MPLRPLEIAQCPLCEEYVRLNELSKVKIRDGVVKTTPSKSGDRIGWCPHCGAVIRTSHVT